MAGPTENLTLAKLVADLEYYARVVQLTEQVAAAVDLAEIHGILHGVTAALGAECSLFATFVPGVGASSSYRLLFDCDPVSSQRYVNERCFANDAWLAYAARHSEPIVAAALTTQTPPQRKVAAIVADAGFVSAALIPAHSGAGHGRASVLCLGHSRPGFFDPVSFNRLRVAARSVAMEFHDWWGSHERRELMRHTSISDSELMLLERHCMGQSSKRIAADLHVTRQSVNSRFQRLSAKLGVPNRRAAAQLAIDCGLIVR
ncbi:MAG: autoinducer binding domain-containing protein [Burkholderiaceae bacterium]|nr:autoinducer binding domain-containing protein [Burkholderiaceae bacterium]